MKWVIGAALALGACLWAAADANAQASPGPVAPADVDRGLELAKQAAAAYKEGKFEESIALYEQAFKASPDPISLHNIGRCFEAVGSKKLGDIEPATAQPGVLYAVARDLESGVSYYERYLEAEPTATSRPAVEQRVRALRSQIKLLEDFAKRPIHERPEGRPPARIAAPWILAGIGGATLTGGAVLAGLASSKESTSNDRDTSGLDTVESAEDATMLATTANVLFGIGGAISLAGGIWGIVDLASGPPDPPKAGSLRLEVGPAWIGATLSL
jgi:tetratricopeptide (TPR) repeat protein